MGCLAWDIDRMSNFLCIFEILKNVPFTYRPRARYDPRAPPPHLSQPIFFEPPGCPEYEIGL